ncbi:MAG: glycoside hydrolase family 3 C-terminal domain-containing protein [Chloroflexota bacterium]
MTTTQPDMATLITQLTLAEKAALCTGASPWRTVPIERLGIPSMIVADGPHGLRRSTDVDSMITESYPAICFPVAAALSASWNTDLLYEMGQALADEAIALNTDILLGPGMNIKRSPLCGRNFEYFSEDPLLSGEMSAALVNGIQSKGVGTSVKHFAVNNQETRRFTVDAILDERSLREIYLRGFEIAVEKSQPWTIMCAYNSVNGEFCAQNHTLLTDILRDEWGYQGFVMSDWGAVWDRVASLQAGLELEMPGPSSERTQAVIDAVEAGELDEAILNQAVERLLTIIFRAAETPKGQTELNIQADHALARKVASECMVLLKNDNDLLPLSGDENLAVIGKAAVTPGYQGGGSSHINATQVDKPLDFLRERAELHYAEGDTTVEHNQLAIDEAIAIATDADVAVLFIALPPSVESEGFDRPHMRLTDQQVALIKAVATANDKTVVILNNGAAVDMRDWIDAVDAVIEAWLPGQAGAGAIVDMFYGDVNPSGKLGETFPLALEHTPAHLTFPGERDTVHYGEGIFVGYRGYEASKRRVLFPFGYGLSYTTFEYSNLRVSQEKFTLNDALTIQVDITNTGAVAGKEIVQLYVHDVESALPRPYKELKAFTKVALEVGETKTVTLELKDRAFMYYDPTYAQWLAEAGTFELLVGSSSVDIHLRHTITLTQGTPLPVILTGKSTVTEWMANPRAAQFIQPILSVFGESSGDPGALGVDMSEFFKDLPVIKLLAFLSDNLEQSPDAIVAGWLSEIHAES